MILGILTSMTSVAHADCDILAQIHQAQQDLSSVSLQVGTVKHRFVEKRIGRTKVVNDPDQSIVMGLLNLDTCVTQVVTTTQHGNQLIVPEGYQISPVRRANGIQWNDWATQYQVATPVNWFLIGVQYPYTPKATNTVTPVFYTPYTEALRVPQIINAGKNYPIVLVGRADDALWNAGVHSLTYPDMPVTDLAILRPEYAARKLPIEHMDDSEFLLDPAFTTDQVAVIMGANGDHAWSFTCSSAHACGPNQFIKSTWRLIVQKYPAAHLDPNFTVGARDPLQAMMATRLLDEYNFFLFKQSLTDTQFTALTADPHFLEEALASAYNTGATRTVAVLKAYFAHPTKYGDWTEAKGRGSKSHLVAQTKGYIAKLRYIREQWQ